MRNNHLLHSISPELVLRGEKAWEEGQQFIPSISDSPILIGRSAATRNIRNHIKDSLSRLGIKVISTELKYDCCELDLKHIKEITINN